MKKMQFTLVLVCLVMLMASCGFIGGERVRGDGNWQSQERQVGNFKDIKVSGAADVHLTQGESKPIRIEVDQNLLEYIEVYVEGTTLHVETRTGFNLDPSKDMAVYVTAPSFNEIKVSGAGNIVSESKINNPGPIDLRISGAGNIKVEVNAPKVGVDISGAGTATLVGETKDFDLDISGAGKARCFDLKAENAKVRISGAGNADVFASLKLDAHTSGAGSVKFKGKPTDVKSSKSGAGSIESAD